MSIQIRVLDRSGREALLEAEVGTTLMDAIRDSGSDDLLAVCGGCCSCATCHVYVEGGLPEPLAGLSEDENDLLESSDHRTAVSRLSCQIILSRDLDGLQVRIAPDG